MTVTNLPAPFTQNGTNLPSTVGRTDRMQQWLDLFMKTAEVAEVLARTSFVPAGMQGKPAEVAASMMKGYELGMDPLDALANMFVVKGKVGFYAEFMRRRIIKAGHELYITEATDSRAVVKGRRRDGDREAEWQQASFTAEQAKKAGIDLGGYPADKLVARATSRLCRRAFPDVLSGAEIVEDIMDGIVVDVVEDQAAPPPVPAGPPVLQRRRAARKPAATRGQPPLAEPAPVADIVVGDSLDDFPDMTLSTMQEPEPVPVVAGEPADETPVPISAAQLKKLSIQLREAGFEEREARHDFVASAIGRPVGSAKELTRDEASKVIDLLENDQPTLDTESQQ
jgi:hypothetical protein